MNRKVGFLNQVLKLKEMVTRNVNDGDIFKGTFKAVKHLDVMLFNI